MCAALAGTWLLYMAQQQASPQSVVERVSRKVVFELEKVDEDATFILAGGSLDKSPPKSGYYFYLYDNGKVRAWSDNSFVPSPASVADTFALKLLKAGNGDYLAKKWKIDDRQFLLAVIPLFKKYTITNDYISTEWNTQIFPFGSISILEPNASIGLSICVEDSCPFKISFLPNELPAHENFKVAGIICIIIALLLFIAFCYPRLIKTGVVEFDFTLLCLFFLMLRFVMVKFNFPAGYTTSLFFNPQVFASSSLNASLGDLLLNETGILIVCIFLFKRYHHFNILRYIYTHSSWRWVFSVFCSLAVLFSALFPFVVVQTLYNNSSIDLDITKSIRFDALRTVSFIIVLVAGVCSFLFSHVFIRLLLMARNKVHILLSFSLAIVLFIGFNTYTRQLYLSSLLLGTVYFLVVYSLGLSGSLRRLSFTTFAYLFVGIFFLSANGTYATQHFTGREKIESHFRFATNFLIDRDYFGEYLLQESAEKIANDAFIQLRLASPFLGREAIRNKIRQVFLPNYFNKYDVEIFLFDASGEPVNNGVFLTFDDLTKGYEKEVVETGYEKVFYLSGPATDITQKYLTIIPISRSRHRVGHVVLEMSLKKIIPENVYPELLVDNRFQQFYRTQDISYAVFTTSRLLFSAGNFNYEERFEMQWMGIPELHLEGIHKEGYDHIAVEDQNGKIAVVSSQQISRTYLLANFSFLLVLGLMLILVFLLALGLVNYLRGEKLYYATRIQLLLNMAFFFPLIIVSITTLSLTTRSSQRQLNDEFQSKAKAFGQQLAVQLDDYLKGRDENVVSFENQVSDLAKLTGLDANVYRGEGTLIASSQPLIFESNLVSNYMNNTALRKILRGENTVVDTEHVGKLSYHVAYTALKDPLSGTLNGILAIPFFQSGRSLEKVQINIIATILNIFTLVFIVLVILSYFVSKWLTFPLNFITQSLRRTSLSKTNEPLTWKADDEIGMMVKEYNQMLFKLGESKAELEQTQRERAWREIAQQVAHEIKNPLTPMKLTLQQLERALQSGLSSEAKTEKAVQSLLTQVDTLNDIASSFSTFAKMPEPIIKAVELVSLLKRVVDLHAHSGTINFQVRQKEAWVKGDEQLLGRTFSNIILNALQAAKPGTAMRVMITIEKLADTYRIIFSDTGKGMEADVAERIFIPHFTTKKSGSGLGLAIAKQAIELMAGKIWFETVRGKGTKFFIELPANDV